MNENRPINDQAPEGEATPSGACSFSGNEGPEFGMPFDDGMPKAATRGDRTPPRPAHLRDGEAPTAPPKRPAKASRAAESSNRNAVAPRPSTPAPGSSGKPSGPQPIETPNLWGPDSAIMRQPSVVERDLADEDLQKRGKLPRKVMIAIYIACVLAVIAAVTLLVLFLSPLPEPNIVSCQNALVDKLSDGFVTLI